MPHASEVDAQRAADKMNAKKDSLGSTSPYLCNTCHWWHIGKQRRPFYLFRKPRRKIKQKEGVA